MMVFFQTKSQIFDIQVAITRYDFNLLTFWLKWVFLDGVEVEDAEQVLNGGAALLQARHPKFNRKRLKYMERILKIGETEEPHAIIVDSDT